MNIMLVNHYAGHPRLGMEYRPFFMAREWQKKGHSVQIIASSQAHVRQTQPIMENWKKEETLDGVSYTWLKSPHYQGNGIKRIINIFVFLFRLYVYGTHHLKQKPDVIIASSTYPLDIYICKKLARKYNAKLIFEVHDLWPLSPIELGGLSTRHPFILLLQHAEDYAYKNANKVVSILPSTLEHMVSRGMNPDKFFHIPNGIFPDQWDTQTELPTPHKELIQKLKEQGQFLLAYGGSHGTANDLESLIQACPHLHQNISVILFGKGPEKSTLQKLATQMNLTNVHFLPALPKTMVPAILDQMDALYIGLAPHPLFRFGVSPNKLMDYMMAAKPIVYAIDSGNHPVSDANCGIETTPGNPVDIAHAINQISEISPEQRQKLGFNGREYVTQKHDYNKLADDFIEVISNSP